MCSEFYINIRSRNLTVARKLVWVNKYWETETEKKKTIPPQTTLMDLNLNLFITTSSLEELVFQMLANRWCIFPYKNLTEANRSVFRVVPFKGLVSLYCRYVSPWDAILYVISFKFLTRGIDFKKWSRGRVPFLP